jgi:hypothetical protein
MSNATPLTLGHYSLLTVHGDAKSIHGEEIGLLSGLLYLAPANLSGVLDVCAYSSDGCRAACLNTAGHAGIIKKGEITNKIQQARIRRTVLFLRQREEFWARLCADSQQLITDAARNGLVPCMRLNATSDLPWERMRVSYHVGSIRISAANMMELFPQITFYDYTAYPYAKRPSESLPTNYDLTFSRKENTTDEQVADELAHGRNVAIPFSTISSRSRETGEHLHALPSEYLGAPVINGDLNDARFADPSGVIVGLRAKGDARKDASGFVVQV